MHSSVSLTSHTACGTQVVLSWQTWPTVTPANDDSGHFLNILLLPVAKAYINIITYGAPSHKIQEHLQRRNDMLFSSHPHTPTNYINSNYTCFTGGWLMQWKENDMYHISVCRREEMGFQLWLKRLIKINNNRSLLYSTILRCTQTHKLYIFRQKPIQSICQLPCRQKYDKTFRGQIIHSVALNMFSTVNVLLSKTK